MQWSKQPNINPNWLYLILLRFPKLEAKNGCSCPLLFFSIFLWAVTWGHSWTTMMWLRVWIRLWLCGSGIRRSQAIQPRGGSMSRRNLPPISTRKLTRKEWWRWKGKLRTPITWQQWVHILKTRNWSFRNTGCPPCLEILFSHLLLLTKLDQVLTMGKFGPTAINFGDDSFFRPLLWDTLYTNLVFTSSKKGRHQEQ